ncbi:MAG: 16S rRNA (guanine(527)-N(7))-methyltransferase RsmG [Bacteroidota bacterium]
MDLIQKYYPELTHKQISQFRQIEDLYMEWNSRINVISRKDMEYFYMHHVLHSLGIAKVLKFLPGSRVMDAGTGGGFPGIPLAILFPETEFLLVDSIGKKIRVVREVANSSGICNVEAIQSRAEDVKQKFDFVVSRAVTALPDFILWTENKIKRESRHTLKNGILYLKGGDLAAELAPLKNRYCIFDLKDYFQEDFFETKKVVHVSI